MQWVPELPEFREWQRAEPNSTKSVLWLRGAGGIGKSIISGSLVDYLHEMFSGSDALISYFFCKAGEAKLQESRAIVRTIVYQCMLECPEVRERLKDLKKSQFSITSHGGIRSLVDLLLAKPLATVNKDLHIILDGVDELTRTQIDVADGNRTEVEIAIVSISRLPRARVLIISRPDIPLGDITFVTKSITELDTLKDIETYVGQEVSKLKYKVEKWYSKDSQDLIKQLVEGLFI